MAYKKKYALVAVAGICIASGVAWWLQRQSPTPSSSGAAPAAAPGGQRVPAVEVAKVAQATLIDEAQSVGSLRSRQGVMIRPEVAGRIKTIQFTEGQRVAKGQLLVQLDDQLQAAQVAQAKAEMSIAEANHKRNQDLVAQNFISKRSVDESAAALEVAHLSFVDCMGVALAGAHGQYFMVLAFAKAPASALSPYLYSAIGFSALGGWWMFGHLPDALDFVGMAMIAGFGLVAGWSRTRGHP